MRAKAASAVTYLPQQRTTEHTVVRWKRKIRAKMMHKDIGLNIWRADTDALVVVARTANR
jgi:hypothetical protein